MKAAGKRLRPRDRTYVKHRPLRTAPAHERRTCSPSRPSPGMCGLPLPASGWGGPTSWSRRWAAAEASLHGHRETSGGLDLGPPQTATLAPKASTGRRGEALALDRRAGHGRQTTGLGGPARCGRMQPIPTGDVARPVCPQKGQVFMHRMSPEGHVRNW